MIRAIDLVAPATLQKRLKRGTYQIDEFGDLEKRCSHCRDYWPADEDFFFAGRNYDDGLHCQCKACYLERRYGAERTGTPHAMVATP